MPDCMTRSRTKTVLFFGCTKRDEDFIYKEAHSCTRFKKVLEIDPPVAKLLSMVYC